MKPDDSAQGKWYINGQEADIYGFDASFLATGILLEASRSDSEDRCWLPPVNNS